MLVTEKNIAEIIDHTCLKPDTTRDKVVKMCMETIENHFAAICIPPYYVKLAAKKLEGENPKVCTVVGFPFGYSTTHVKVEEAAMAIAEGADEIDMVVNIAAIKDKNWNYVKDDIQMVTQLVQKSGGIVKVIFETALLNEDEIAKLCEICRLVRVDFVKTSTGFAKKGADVATIDLIKKHLDPSIGIKASGGIKTREFALELLEAGVTRIGTSSALNLIS